jgi:hypothetical protein
MRRLLLSVAAVSVVAGFIATPSASAQQSVNFFLGGFVPTSADARGNVGGGVTNDVLVRDLDFLSFRIDRFTGPTVGGEWLVELGNHFEAGAGLGFYQRTVSAADRLGRVNSTTGAPIVADLKLRIVPFTATVRAFPLGHDAPIVPYVGAGVGVYAWRYSESGEFVDSVDNKTVFAGTFAGSGAAVGPVVLAGVRVPIGPMAPGFEVRWQKAQGNLPSSDFEPGRVIDLGGFNYLFTFNIKF